MKNLTPPKGSYLNRLSNIIKDKYEPGKSRLNILKPQISSRYIQYQRHYLLDALENIIAINYSIQESADMENCYTSSTITLSELVKEIRTSQPRDLQGTCQYCGIQKPNTIDHYLPQSQYPDFSVLALNMIPCCNDCNTKKNNYWIENGFRGIINFYIDNLPNVQFLFCAITFDANNEIPNIQYSLNIPNSINSRLRDIIVKHFKRLDLCNRYVEYVHDYVTDKINTLCDYLNSKDPEEIKERMEKDAESLANRYGINNWKTVLTKELSKSRDFINIVICRMPR